MHVDFDHLRPEERRLVLVASEVKYRELMAQLDWRKVVALVGGPLAGGIVGVIATALGPTLAASGYLASTFQASETRKQGFLERLTTKGEIPIPHLSPRDAVERFRFDHGHPVDGAAYVLDPCVEDHYLAPAVANERLAQEKLAAFVQIAASLGARRIEIVSGEVLSRGAGANVDVPLDEAAGQVGLTARFDQKNSVARQVYVELDEPPLPPHLPEALARWTEVDPQLRALVQLRLNARPRTAKISLRFENTIDLDARAIAELASRKIGVGGEYRTLTASLWSFDVEFWPTS